MGRARSLLVALSLVGCADPIPEPRYSGTQALLEDAQLDVSAMVEQDLRVLRLEGGQAWIALDLEGRDGVREQTPYGLQERFDLPLAADLPLHVGSLPATVTTDAGDRYTLGLGPSLPGARGVRARLEGRALIRPVDIPTEETPDFTLTYQVSTAALAALGALPGASPAEILPTRIGDSESSSSAWRLEEALSLRLPAEPASLLRARVVGPGRLQANGRAYEEHPAWIEIDLEAGAELRALDDTVWLAEPHLVPTAPGEPATNVLVLLLDTLRADRVGPWRDGASLTPELDRLLERSTVFDRAWSTASWTLPSIATLMTGRHAAEHGAYHGTAALSLEPVTLPEAFQRAGYRTAAFTDGGYFLASFGLDRGFDRFDATRTGVRSSAPAFFEWLSGSEDRGWFAVLHTYAVHEPYEPLDPRAAQILASFAPDQASIVVHPSEGVALLDADDPRPLPTEMTRAMAELYDLEVRELDGDLAWVFDRLEQLGQAEHTVVAVVADHGEEFGERGLAGHGDTLFPEQLHVPFAVHVPDRPGARVGAPVSTVDFAATVADAAGLDPGAAGLPGSALLAAVAPRPTFAWRQPADGRGALRAVRADDLLLLRGEYRYPRPLPADGLFDLGADPRALQDLSALDAERAARESERLLLLLDEFPEPPPIEEGELDPALAAQLEALGYR